MPAEFWRGVEPIAEPMKPDALPEVYLGKGPLAWLDETGAVVGLFDVHDYLALCRAHFERVGLGAGFVDALLR